MSYKPEQCVCIKFCTKLRKSATETFEIIKKAFEDEAMSNDLKHLNDTKSFSRVVKQLAITPVLVDPQLREMMNWYQSSKNYSIKSMNDDKRTF